MNKKAIFKIKNTNEYIAIPDRDGMGSYKDFFYGNDHEFSIHRSSLISQVSHVAEELILKGNNNSFATMKVSLRDDALAKSHRPTKAIFNHKHPVIGGGKMGELYVQVTPSSLITIAERLAQAKVESDVKFNQSGKIESKVGQLRSEVGAIDNLSIYSSDDKCSLSDSELLIDIINNNRDIIVELFEPVNSDFISNQAIERLKNEFISSFCSSLSYFRLQSESKYFSDGILSLSPTGKRNDELFLLEAKHVIKMLREQAIVKCFYLTPIINFSEEKNSFDEKLQNFPKYDEEENYPKVILIDKGVRSNLLLPWVKGKFDFLGDETLDEYHADEMASILIGSKYLNELSGLEVDGCDIYDIWIPSTEDSFSENFSDVTEFMDWLYLQVQTARNDGYRVISMSINFQCVISDSEYSLVASRIDFISRKFEVIFVISAGNLDYYNYRPEWPRSTNDVFRMLARNQRDDKLLQPADSVSAITVSAVNHVENELIVNGAPARYARRGPSTSYGIKPDLVHFGGIGDENNSFINTLDGQNRMLSSSHGTSLAVPHVAKTIAILDLETNQSLSIPSLKALMIHNAKKVTPLEVNDLAKESREFTGFGLASSSGDIIKKDESSFTFLFEDQLKKGQIVEFLFVWPEDLVNLNGKCKGKIKMTLVYEPPIDRSYGEEYIRANVDASLQQEKITKDSSTYTKVVKSIWDTKLGEEANYEKSLVKHGFKWWPIKVYEKTSKQGIGNSTNWRLRVSSQVRDGVIYPDEGIKFSVIVTIEDHKGESNKIYNQMVISLNQIGVKIESINVRDEVRV
ncbi:S8 family serine peptidase [Photobacterium leiognathi]|uniref:S8 family serine peptidase n=1 Tax=Photobacterium leiognathi TaxID=553611 RepID=UPI003DA01676